jgi:hypothetical protein
MALFDEIEDRVRVELDAIGREMVEDFRGRIGESYPPASVPGEYPHRRSGNLQQQTGHIMTEFPSRFRLTLYNAAEYALRLKIMGRRMLEYLVPDWLPMMTQRLRDAAHGRASR